MLRLKFALVSIALVLALAATDVPAIQRTFVASNGSDTNPCTLPLPCRGFAAAVAAVANDGEVIALDSAGYGTLTITKPVTIAAPKGVYAGVTVTSGSGIVINTSGTVTLRGLTINGQGGFHGIEFQAGPLLQLFDVEISGLGIHGILASSGGFITAEGLTVRGCGLDALRLSNNTHMHLRNSRIDTNLRALRAEGGTYFTAVDTSFVGNQYEAIYLQADAPQTAALNLDRCLIAENGHGTSAIQTRAAGAAARVDATITRSTLTLNGANAITIGYAFGGDGFQAAYITDNAITNNGGAGVDIAVPQFDSTQGKIVLSGNTIARNNYGIGCNASGLITRGNNTIRDNVSGQIQNCTATVNESGQ